MTTETVARAKGPDAQAKYAKVDCDVHPAYANGINDLNPYLSAAAQHRLGTVSYDASMPASQFMVPKNIFWVNPAGSLRSDARTPSGGPPGSDAEFVSEQLLDAYGIDRAILNSTGALGLAAVGNPELGAILATADNDWLIDKWLNVDDRYRGLLTIVPHDVPGAVREIERVGSDSRFVAIFMPMTDINIGDQRFWPIYEAAAGLGLPIQLHPSATEGMFPRAPHQAGGPHRYFVEYHTAQSHIFSVNMVSMVVSGIFDKFPSLKLIVGEASVAWVPNTVWRLDRNWHSAREETPWLTKPPSEYIWEHVRFLTQPFMEPEKLEHVAAICDMIHAGETMMYSSDYPHWDFDNPDRALAGLPDDIRSRVFAENAIETYSEDRL
jgi:predicted TIM-barrel fold metal-dependent hydrolase